MSALDAQLWPHLKTSEVKNRLDNLFRSPDRLKFAREQATLPRVGKVSSTPTSTPSPQEP